MGWRCTGPPDFGHILINKIAQALGKKYLVYDASKAMFEDVLGYPDGGLALR